MHNYNITIIGSGPAGYQAAVRSSQLGYKTAVIEKDKIGGVCLNTGCVPTKGLVKISDFLYDLKNSDLYGVSILNYNTDIKKMLHRNNVIINELQNGILKLFKKYNIDLYEGNAKIIDKTKISVNDTIINSDKIFIAVGTQSRDIIKIDHPNVLNHISVLNLQEIPKSIAIIGAGAIGMEYASIFNLLGSEVVLIEKMDSILPGFDEDIQRECKKVFKKRGIKIFTGINIEDVVLTENKFHITGQFKKLNVITADYLLNAAGRVPVVDNLWDNTKVNIKLNPKGFIETNDEFQTTEPNIYAVGDITGKHLTAYAASYQGIKCIEFISNNRVDTIDYTKFPKVIYTEPAAASIGLTEKECKIQKYDYWAKKSYLRSGTMSKTDNRIEGFIKTIIDKNDNSILGAHIVGNAAYEQIHLYIPFIYGKVGVECISQYPFIHPSFSEMIKENVDQYFEKAIH